MLDGTDRFCVICSLNNYFKGMDIINKVRKTPLSSSLQYNGPNKKVKAVWSFVSFYLEACKVVGMAGVAGG